MSYTYIFDLDKTLYPLDNPLFNQTGTYAKNVIIEASGLKEDDYYATYQKYFIERKDPFAEMCKTYNIPAENLLDYHMHNDYSVLSPCSTTRDLLQKLPAKDIVVYTDATTQHAKKALQALDLEGVFSKVIDLYDMELRCKGSLDSFDDILEKLKVKGSECVMVEDVARNLVAAKNSDMRTVLITDEENFKKPEYVDEITPTLQDWLHIEVAKG